MVKTRVFTYKRKEKIEKIYGGKLVKVRAHLLGAKKKKKKEDYGIHKSHFLDGESGLSYFISRNLNILDYFILINNLNLLMPYFLRNY